MCVATFVVLQTDNIGLERQQGKDVHIRWLFMETNDPLKTVNISLVFYPMSNTYHVVDHSRERIIMPGLIVRTRMFVLYRCVFAL